MPVRGRFAPSPSGRLHIGNMLSSLLAWLDVRSRGGEMLFRLEDLDPERSWEDCALMMADDLRWLGLDWDLGWPMDSGCRRGGARRNTSPPSRVWARRGCSTAAGARARSAWRPPPPTRGRKTPAPAAAARCRRARSPRLERRGRRAAYKVIAPDADVTVEDGHYGTYTENLARGGGDFIVRRSDGVFAYQLAVSVDDAAMGVTRVVRARDLLPSAPRQKWLIETLGGTAPEYCHAPLMVSPSGRKLSKREGDLNMESLRKRYTPEGLTGVLACLCGLIERPESVSPRELVGNFDWNKVAREDVILPDWV